MKYLFIGCLLLFMSFSTFAQQVKKDQVKSMIQSLMANGAINAEQAKAATKELDSMSSKDWEGLINKANDTIKNNPEKVEKIKKQLQQGGPIKE